MTTTDWRRGRGLTTRPATVVALRHLLSCPDNLGLPPWSWPDGLASHRGCTTSPATVARQARLPPWPDRLACHRGRTASPATVA